MRHDSTPSGRADGPAGAPAGPGAAEELLLRHDRVAQALVVPGRDDGREAGPDDGREPGPDGARPVAYVVPASAGKERAEAQVGEWQQIYNRLYAGSPPTGFGDNFTGWNSRYDGRPIDLDEMRRWRAATVDRIRELRPRRLLEIGVGSGLLLSRLAADCEAYWATDLSPAAVDELARHVEDDPRLAGRVTLRAQAADRTDGLPAGHFDTVVVNSVVQYFPDRHYLTTVVDRALELLAPGGALFLGDVRDPRTLEDFHTAAALRRSGATDPAALLRTAHKTLTKGEELLVHPDYFADLARTRPDIAGVDVRLKLGDYHNELSRHRYDVVLHKAPADLTDVTDCPRLRWGTDVTDVADLVRLPAAAGPPVRITGIPNARLTPETAARRALADGDTARARHLLAHPDPAAVDPHALTRAAALAGHHLALAPDPDRADHFEAVLTRPRPVRTALTGTCRPGAAAPRALAEVPAAAHRAAALAARLQDWLRDRLPEHEIPAVVVLDALPPVPAFPGGTGIPLHANRRDRP